MQVAFTQNGIYLPEIDLWLDCTEDCGTNWISHGHSDHARGLHGRLVDELGPIRPDVPPYPLASAVLAPVRSGAERRGEYGFGPMWAGQAGPLGQALPAAKLTRKLASDALAVLRGEA